LPLKSQANLHLNCFFEPLKLETEPLFFGVFFNWRNFFTYGKQPKFC
jgi:hypothetical protein